MSRLIYRAAAMLSHSPSAPRAQILEHTLRIFEEIRLPYGNKVVENGRRVLCDFQLTGPSGMDIERSVKSIIKTFEDSIRVIGGHGPNADVSRGLKLFDLRCCQ